MGNLVFFEKKLLVKKKIGDGNFFKIHRVFIYKFVYFKHV
jgi:hypothetical protein